MIAIDLIYDLGCPNVPLARANLLRAFSRAGVAAKWQEHAIGDPEAPARTRGYGSPTILVDGIDVAGSGPGSEVSCRWYGESGAPDVELIVASLARSLDEERAAPSGNGGSGAPTPRRRRPWTSAAAVPGIGIALMPKIVCPLCWPALTGALSATGLAFLIEDRWFLPISAALLATALVALGWRARARRGYGPLCAGAVASLAIMVGKFALEATTLAYAGVAVLVAACIWNAWPLRSSSSSCSSCQAPQTRNQAQES